jgi:hypothetical protein
MPRLPWTLRFALVGLMMLHANSTSATTEVELAFAQGLARIKVPATGIRNIEAVVSSPTLAPHIDIFVVEICFSRYYSGKICNLTRRFIGKPIEIRVGCELVASPIVREPLCNSSCIDLSADDLPDAERLVAKLRDGSRTSCPSTS